MRPLQLLSGIIGIFGLLFWWGGWWLVVPAGLVGLVFGWTLLSVQADEEAFQKLVIETAQKRMHWQEYKAINTRLARHNINHSMLVRHVQIMRESVDIAAASRNRITVDSRLAGVTDAWRMIQKEHGDLLAAETSVVLEWLATDEVSRAWTEHFIVSASAYLAKSEKLKTEKAKAKYKDQAAAVLNEATSHDLTDKNKIAKAMEILLSETASLSP